MFFLSSALHRDFAVYQEVDNLMNFNIFAINSALCLCTKFA
jgi:hypothetical protein